MLCTLAADSWIPVVSRKQSSTMLSALLAAHKLVNFYCSNATGKSPLHAIKWLQYPDFGKGLSTTCLLIISIWVWGYHIMADGRKELAAREYFVVCPITAANDRHIERKHCQKKIKCPEWLFLDLLTSLRSRIRTVYYRSNGIGTLAMTEVTNRNFLLI